jgi:hypothetical protein
MALVIIMRLSSRKGAHAVLSSAARQETRVREMAKVCALCAPGFLLGVFFGLGGLFFDPLRIFVIDGGPEIGGATAAYLNSYIDANWAWRVSVLK